MKEESLKLIYHLVRQIPKGKVATYGQIALRARGPQGPAAKINPRMVGRALHLNPDPKHIPCHRVVGFDGHLVGYAYGIEKKRQLLLKEGVKFKDRMHVDLRACLWQPEIRIIRN